ncbi:helix-turn-helix domain-containing protein, partial [Pseudonocardia acaciae]|uniref:helix-turn-helix domain-containing protein n=1 Tax=Pseudonocardia acaciae TaxID=551276 RepID=UPI0012EE9E0B
MTNRTVIGDDHDGLGDRVRGLRERALGPTGRKMTQADLAAAAGVSLDLIRKLEQGVRHTASLPSLHKLARALDVDIVRLLGKEVALPQPSENSGVVALRRAVTGIDDLLGASDVTREPSLDDLRRTVTYTWGSYWSGRYDKLGETLPETLRLGRALDLTGEAADLVAQLYQAAGCTLVQLGQPDAAHIAVREALRIA